MRRPYLGVWLDHREAYFIWLGGDGHADVQHVQDEDYPVKGQKAERTVGGRAGAFGSMPPRPAMEEKQRREAAIFQERLVKLMRPAESIYVFGPGLAKKELMRRVKGHKEFSSRVRAVENAKRMTQPQMVARVKDFFGLLRPAAEVGT